MSITLHTLGRLAVFHEGEEYPALISQKLRCALLLYLAVEGEATRDTILALLWPDREAERGRHALSQTLYELRQAFGSDWLETHGERVRVTEAVTADARAFEEAVEAGDLERAAELYRGPFLEGVHLAASNEFESWVDRKRAQLRRSHRVVHRDLIEWRLEEGRFQDALADARRWVAFEPLDDEAQHKLVELLARSGQRSEALRQYERFREALAEDDLEPLEDTRALVEEIRGGSEGGRSQDAGGGADGGPGESLPLAGASPAPGEASQPGERVRERPPAYEGPAGAHGEGGAPERGRQHLPPPFGPGQQEPPFDFMRRRIWLIPIGYASVSFVILELASMVFPLFGLGDDAFRVTAVVILLGFPLVIAAAWLMEPALWPRFLREGTERGGRGSRIAPFLASLVVALLGMGAIWTLWPGLREPVAGPLPGPDPERRLAVLYLDPLDPADEEASLLARGLTESLIDELHSVPDLDVISRAGVRPFRGLNVPPDSIGRVLNVGLLVHGSVGTSGDSVRVSVELIRARSETVINSWTLSHPRGQVLPLVNDFLRQVTSFLRPTLGSEVQLRSIREGTDNPEAWRLVQEAMRYEDEWWRLYESGNVGAVVRRMERAEASLLQAITLDPEWPEPRIRVGWLLMDEVRVAPDRPGSGWEIGPLLTRAAERADQVLEKDATHARALELRGAVAERRALMLRTDPERATRLEEEALDYYGRAVGTDPTLARAWMGIGQIQFDRGEFAAARAATQRAYAEDPYLRGAENNLQRLAMAAFELGLEGEAMRTCETGLEWAESNPEVLPMFLDCTLTVLAWGDSIVPDPARAADAVRRLRSMARPDVARSMEALFLYQQAGVLARAGEADSARAVLERARTAAEEPEWLRWMEAAVLARIGEEGRALALLEGYAEDQPSSADSFLRRRYFSPLRGDPRFERLLRAME